MATILLVEDDATLADMYQLMLQMKGHTVLVSHNGQDAIVQAKASKPDAILLDMMMPVLNGIETLKQMKALPELNDIPVAMLSNLADDQQAEIAMLTGATKYVIKSNCTADSLHDLVFGMLQKKVPHTAPNQPPA